MRKRLMRMVLLAVVGAVGTQIRKRIQQRNETEEARRRMAAATADGHRTAAV